MYLYIFLFEFHLMQTGIQVIIYKKVLIFQFTKWCLHNFHSSNQMKNLPQKFDVLSFFISLAN